MPESAEPLPELGNCRVRWRQAAGTGRDGTPGLPGGLEKCLRARGAGLSSTHVESGRGAWWGRFEDGTGAFFVKGRLIDSRRARLASLVSRRGLAREWENTLWLADRGLPAPEPVALGEFRRLGMLRMSVFVSRWLTDGVCLADAVAGLGREARLSLVSQAGTLMGTQFRHGAIHRQFHPWNVLVRLREGDPELIPIDLQHLWVSPVLTDDDYLWALDQASFWLHDPVIDWSSAEEAGCFYGPALEAAGARLKDRNRIERAVEGFIRRGRMTRKVHRRRWQPG